MFTVAWCVIAMASLGVVARLNAAALVIQRGGNAASLAQSKACCVELRNLTLRPSDVIAITRAVGQVPWTLQGHAEAILETLEEVSARPAATQRAAMQKYESF